MKTTKTFSLMAAILTLSGCQTSVKIDRQDLTGQWIEIMPANPKIRQGVILQDDGTAQSVGMATLQYDSWSLSDSQQLILNGKSIGNGQTLTFSDTLHIVSLNHDTLTLGKGDMYRIHYIRENHQTIPGGSDAAMGYTYSELLQKKIRIFEEGIRLLPASDPDSTSAAYLIFNPDSSRVEIFMAEKQTILEHRRRPDGVSVWNLEDDDTYQVEKKGDQWFIRRGQQLLYSTQGMEDAIQATFTTTQGDTIQVLFHQQLEIAQLTFQGQPILLNQYRTASGYGYQNPFYDLRGKGTEATLTRLSDQQTWKLNEKK